MVSTDDDRLPRDAVEQRSKALFDASVISLSAGIRSKLAQARHAAVDSLQQPAPSVLRKWLPAATAAAVALTVTAVLFTGAPLRRPASEATLTADDLALLLEDDSLDLIEEIEFYSWLDDGMRSDRS